MEKLKRNRIASFVVVGIVYLLASVLGIGLYIVLPFDWWLNLLLADVAATVLTFIFSLIFKNASVYDPYWSVQPIVIIVALAISKGLNPLRILLLVAICLWGIRLTVNWAYTFKSLMHQDWRYTMLNERTGKGYFFVNFTGIHMVPTLIVYGCTLPAAYAFVNDVNLNTGSVIFICVSILAVILQGTADIQMHSFRKHRDSTFIRRGLWKHSRHPNYLGEILMWWGIGASVVVAEPSAWYLLSGALANTVLFLAVSIPMADKRQSKKEGFLEYKKQTWMLLPIPKFINK